MNQPGVVRLFSLICLIVSLFPVSPARASSWLDDDWPERLEFTADPQLIDGTDSFIDFPLLLWLDASEHGALFAAAKADGSDLIITDGDGVTVLEHEVVGYDPVDGEAEIWFRAPTLSDATNQFYLYFGNPDTTVTPASSPFGDEYLAVYHFAEDPGAGLLKDSGPHAVDIAPIPQAAWTSSDTTSGAIGQGWMFNGTTHHLITRDISTADSCYTVSAWLMHTSESSDFFLNAKAPGGYWAISSQAGGGAVLQPIYQGLGGAVFHRPRPLPTNDGFHRFTWSFDGIGDTLRFFYDGVPQVVGSVFPADLSPIYEGTPINPNGADPVGVLGPSFWTVVQDYMNGGADEYRVREGALSEEWVKTEYNNQLAPLAFYTYAFQNNVPVGTGPAQVGSPWIIATPNPFSQRTTVQLSPGFGYTEVSVYDLAGRRVRTLRSRIGGANSLSLLWDGRDTSGRSVASGVYLIRALGPSIATEAKVVLVR